jgi:hypothetical protein
MIQDETVGMVLIYTKGVIIPDWFKEQYVQVVIERMRPENKNFLSPTKSLSYRISCKCKIQAPNRLGASTNPTGGALNLSPILILQFSLEVNALHDPRSW